MTAQEMLIEVNTSLQAIGASKTRKFYPEEIEWYLNKMINRFVQDSIRKKTAVGGGQPDVTTFEIDELYRDAIRNIISEVYLPVNYDLSGTSAVAYLPPSYSYLTDIGGYLDKCSPFKASALQAKVYQVIGVPMPANSVVASPGPYFANLSVTINGTVVYSRSGGYAYNSAFQVIEEICGATDITENMVGPYKKMGYLLLMLPKPAGNNTMVITYDAVTLTGTVLATINANETGATTMPANTPVRSLRDNINYNSIVTPYYKSSTQSVSTSISGSVIQINTATNFIVNGLWVGYIRKPGRISVSLNNTSDIAPEYHNQICDMTVQHIRERIGDPKFQTGIVDSRQ